MFDILQLNDMLMPELFDMAEQLNISDAKGLEKQDLIYKILDKQAISKSNTETQPAKKTARAKKPVTVKATTANITEEAEVMSEEKAEDKDIKPKRKPREPLPSKKVAVSQEDDKAENVNVHDASIMEDDNIKNLAASLLAATEDNDDDSAADNDNAARS